MRYTFSRVAPSGRDVQASWADERLSSEVSGVRFVGSSYGRGFQIGTTGFHDFAAENHLRAPSHRRLRVRGRELRIATAADKRTTIASLIGPRHELMTVFSGPAPTDHTLTGLFGVLRVSDSTSGMVVQPERNTLLEAVSEHVLLVGESHSSLDLPVPAEARRMKPRSKGADTAHGEVWRRPLHHGRRSRSAHDYAYIVGTRKGIGEAVAGPESKISSRTLLDWVDSIDIAWT